MLDVRWACHSRLLGLGHHLGTRGVLPRGRLVTHRLNLSLRGN